MGLEVRSHSATGYLQRLADLEVLAFFRDLICLLEAESSHALGQSNADTAVASLDNVSLVTGRLLVGRDTAGVSRQLIAFSNILGQNSLKNSQLLSDLEALAVVGDAIRRYDGSGCGELGHGDLGAVIAGHDRVLGPTIAGWSARRWQAAESSDQPTALPHPSG